MAGPIQGLFPYPPRPIQSSMMDAIKAAMARKGHIVIEAGTGAGKTIAALVPVIEHSMASGTRVLYLTRTNSQQVQVIKEFRSIVNATLSKMRSGTCIAIAQVCCTGPSR